MYVERTPGLEESRCRAGDQISPDQAAVNARLLNFGKKSLPRMLLFSKGLRKHLLGKRFHPNGGMVSNG